MDKQPRSRKKPSRTQKQTTLAQSFSKPQQKGRQKTRASTGRAGCVNRSGSSPSTPAVIVVDEDDPYTFIDSESNELEPHGMSKADETPRRETLRPTQTPNTSVRSSPKLSTPRPRNSPAIRKVDELKRREEEDFQKALEESRKELEKEERRRRHERREQQADVIEQEQLFSEVEQHKEDITENSAASSETFTKGESGSPKDRHLNSVSHHAESETKDATPSLSTSNASTTHSSRNPLSLKAVAVERLKTNSHIKKDKISSPVEKKLVSSVNTEDREEETTHLPVENETPSLDKELEQEEDECSLQRETPDKTITIQRPCEGDETPPLSNEETMSTKDTEHEPPATEGRNIPHSDVHMECDFSEPVSGKARTDNESNPCVSHKGSTKMEGKHAETSSGGAEMEVDAENGRGQQAQQEPVAAEAKSGVPHADECAQQLEGTSGVGGPVARTGVSQAVSFNKGETTAQRDSSPATMEQKGSVLASSSREHVSGVEIQARSRSSHLSLKRTRRSKSLFEDTKELDPPQAKKLRLEEGKTEMRPRVVISSQSDKQHDNDVKRKTSTSTRQTQEMQPVLPETSEQPPLPRVKSQPKQVKVTAAPKLTIFRKGKKVTSTQAQLTCSNPPPPLYTPIGTLPATYSPRILQCFDDYNAQLLNAQRQALHRVRWGRPVISHSKQSSTALDFKPKQRSTRGSKAKHANTGYSLDLSTARVESPTTSRASKKTTPSSTSKSSPHPVSTPIVHEDNPSDSRLQEPLKATPSRQRSSLGRNILSGTEKSEHDSVSDHTSEEVQQQLVPSTLRTAANAGVASIALHGSTGTRIWDLSDSDDDFERSTLPKLQEEEARSTSHVCAQPSTSPSILSRPRTDDNAARQLTFETSSSKPVFKDDRPQHLHSNTRRSVETADHLDDTSTPSNKSGNITPPSSERGWISRRTGKKSGGSTSSRTKEAVKPMLCVTSRRRKRAQILEDDDDDDSTDVDDVTDVAEDRRRTKCCGKQPLSKRRLVASTTHSSEFEDPEHNSAEDDVLQVLSDHSSDSSIPPFHAASTRGKRQKRGAKQTAIPTDKPKESVIDLTVDSQVMEQGPSPEPPSSFQQPEIPCPICLKMYDQSVIEQHAAECEGDSAGESALGISSGETARVTIPKHRNTVSSKPSSWVQEEDEASTVTDQESDWIEDERFSEESKSDDGIHEDGTRTGDPPWQANHDTCTEDERFPAGPVMHRSEDGGFYIDPSTVSNSPIKSFTRISDLGPKQSDMYYNQFSHKQKPRKRQSGATVGGNTWGRPDFDELLPGGSRARNKQQYNSNRSYRHDPSRSYKWRGRGRGGRRGGWKGRRGRGRKN